MYFGSSWKTCLPCAQSQYNYQYCCYEGWHYSCDHIYPKKNSLGKPVKAKLTQKCEQIASTFAWKQNIRYVTIHMEAVYDTIQMSSKHTVNVENIDDN